VTVPQLSMSPNRTDMRRLLEWLAEPVANQSADLRFEIAWSDPETGPNRAKTFRLDEIDAAIAFAEWINRKGCNVYVGATLKLGDTPAKGRTRTEHAAVATDLPVDIDGEFVDGARKLGTIAKPQLLVLTGRTPQPRGQLWIRINPTEDMKLWSEVNRRSVQFSGGDRFALGTYRLMRLAGTVSYPPLKKQERGYTVELTGVHSVNKAPAYDLGGLLGLFPPVARPTSAPSNGSTGGAVAALGNNLYQRPPVNRTNVAIVRSMLNALPAEFATEYDRWLRVGFALHDFDQGDVGLALWKLFSNKSPKQAARTDFDAIWAGFGRDYPGKKVSLGSLWADARDSGWSPPCRWDRSTKIIC
jgi:hypothetical protein